MKSILNTDRLNRLTARIPPRWADDLSPATAPCPEAGIARMLWQNLTAAKVSWRKNGLTNYE